MLAGIGTKESKGEIMSKLKDLYWRIRKEFRICGYCHCYQTKPDGKVNFGIAFEQPKQYYHEQCLNKVTGKATPNFPAL